MACLLKKKRMIIYDMATLTTVRLDPLTTDTWEHGENKGWV